MLIPGQQKNTKQLYNKFGTNEAPWFINILVHVTRISLLQHRYLDLFCLFFFFGYKFSFEKMETYAVE